MEQMSTKQYFYLMLFLPMISSVVVVSCQSPISRLPNATSSSQTFNEIKTLSRELVFSISNTSRPHLMLFEQFQFEINAIDERNFHSDQFAYLGRTFHLLKNLSTSLENDPFVEPLSPNSLRLINQIDRFFLQNKDIDSLAQQSIDHHIQRKFLIANKNRFVMLLNQGHVHFPRSKKQKINHLMSTLETAVEKSKDNNKIEMRSLASVPYKFPWTKKQLEFLEKISASSIPVSDQGDIFGGSEANSNAIQIQYSLQFILKVLSLYEQKNSWKDRT